MKQIESLLWLFLLRTHIFQCLLCKDNKITKEKENIYYE